jgi:transposase
MISQDLNITLSHDTINKIRGLLHYRYQTPHYRPATTSTQIQRRMDFCTEALTGSVDWAADVIITDESRFGLYDDSRRLWVQRGVFRETTTKPKPKFQKTFMCWGAVGKGYKSQLIFVDGNLNAEKYCQMLKDNRIFETIREAKPGDTVRFQQDGAPCHTAKQTKKFIEEQMPTVPWPANSPDLSVIENVWGILKYKAAERAPKDMPSLKRVLLEEWDAIPQATIDSLIESTPSRFQLCKAHEGKFIGHLLRQTQRNVRENPVPEVPAGFLIPRKVTHEFIGQVVKLMGMVTRKAGSPRRVHIDDTFDEVWIGLQDPASLVPEGHFPQTVRIKGPLEIADDFPEGEFICIQAKCTAVHAGKKLAVHFEVQGIMPSDEWPPEFDPMFEPEVEEGMIPSNEEMG